MARFSLDLSYLIETVRFVPLLFEGCLGHFTDTDTTPEVQKVDMNLLANSESTPKDNKHSIVLPQCIQLQ